jgi:hypothetical protein
MGKQVICIWQESHEGNLHDTRCDIAPHYIFMYVFITSFVSLYYYSNKVNNLLSTGT